MRLMHQSSIREFAEISVADCRKATCTRDKNNNLSKYRVLFQTDENAWEVLADDSVVTEGTGRMRRRVTTEAKK